MMADKAKQKLDLKDWALLFKDSTMIFGAMIVI